MERRRAVAIWTPLNYYGLKRNDVLPPTTVGRLARRIADWQVPGREPAQIKWRGLVGAAVADLSTVGMVLVPSGGLPALAERLGVDRPSLGRNLRTWEAQGLTFQYYGDPTSRHPPMTAVDVRPLSDWLLWLAERLSAWKGSQRYAPTDKQALKIMWEALEQGWRTPPTIETQQDARRLLDSLTGS